MYIRVMRVTVHERLVETYPKVPRYQSFLAEILNNLAAWVDQATKDLEGLVKVASQEPHH